METFKNCPSYPGYQASDLGRVKGLSGRIKSFTVGGGKPYPRANIQLEGRKVKKPLHALVLDAWAGPRPEGTEACHGPAGPLVNTPDNLRWDTRSNNHHDRVRGGEVSRGPSPTRRIRSSDGREFESVAEAHRQTGVNEASIRHVLKSRRATAGGLVWAYL